MIKKKQDDIHGILHVNEIPFLLAILVIFPVRLKKSNLAFFSHTLIGLGHDAAHILFMVFIGPENIKKF